MGYRCGNCNKDFATRKDWLDHLYNDHRSVFLEGDERDIAYHEEKLKIDAKNDSSKAELLDHIQVNRKVN